MTKTVISQHTKNYLIFLTHSYINTITCTKQTILNSKEKGTEGKGQEEKQGVLNMHKMWPHQWTPTRNGACGNCTDIQNSWIKCPRPQSYKLQRTDSTDFLPQKKIIHACKIQYSSIFSCLVKENQDFSQTTKQLSPLQYSTARWMKDLPLNWLREHGK